MMAAAQAAATMEEMPRPTSRQGMEVAVMSLSAQDQRALDRVEDRPADSAPGLTSLLATFTRLASDA